MNFAELEVLHKKPVEFKSNIRYDIDHKCVPFKNIEEVLEFLPYGNKLRIMFIFLIVLGCRISELNVLNTSQFYKSSKGWCIVWRCGKNQKGLPRKEYLPEFVVAELAAHRKLYNCPRYKLFSIDSDTFRRQFNKFVRPNLSDDWNDRVPNYKKSGPVRIEYALQLKGLRKNFQTIEFKKALDKWKDSGVALEMTSKRMRHSSKHMTCNHYIQNFEDLELNKYNFDSSKDFLSKEFQTRMTEY